MKNAELFKESKLANANFVYCDLHVHTLASADILSDGRFSELNDTEKEFLSKTAAHCTYADIEKYKSHFLNKWRDHDVNLSNSCDIESYLQLFIQRRNEVDRSFGFEDGQNWAIIGLTDHNVASFATKFASYAWEKRNQTRLIFLPGIELTVGFKLKNREDQIKIHVCVLFQPGATESNVSLAINEAKKAASMNHDAWEFGNDLYVDNITQFISGLRHHRNYPAICVAAHIDTSKGIESELSDLFRNVKCLTRDQAEFTRLWSQLKLLKTALTQKNGFDAGYTTREIQQSRIQLKEVIGRIREYRKRNPKEIAISALKIIGECGFDALQVAELADSIHYRCLHRFKIELGRSVPIICSDSHTINNIFNCSLNAPYLKMPGIASTVQPSDIFSQVRNHGLRFGEVRFTTVPVRRSSCWIRGIEITPDSPEAKKFWPFKAYAQERSFVVPFSRNLNCLIGGRGSGKSAMIEAVAFLLSPNDFMQNDSKKEDWFARAKNTLSGCNVRICWHNLDEKFSVYKKNAVFAKRYFDPDDKFDKVVFSDLEGEQILGQEINELCKIDLYRLNDLEEIAKDKDKLRELFDGICGSEVKAIRLSIDATLAQLKLQRPELKRVALELAAISKEGAPLRNYIALKKQYDDANKADIKEKYDRLDSVTVASNTVSQAEKDWQALGVKVNVSSVEGNLSQFFNHLTIKIHTKENTELLPYNEPIYNALFKPAADQKIISNEVKLKAKELDSAFIEVTKAIADAKTEIEGTKNNEIQELDKSGLPVGSVARQAKKKAFDEACAALDRYRTTLNQWDTLVNERKTLFRKLKLDAQRRTELRSQTAINITKELKENLDPNILVIEADAKATADRSRFQKWLNDNLFPSRTWYKENRIMSLMASELTPEILSNILLGNQDHSKLVLNNKTNSDGGIPEDDAISYVEHAGIRFRINFKKEIEENKITPTALPIEFQNGIWQYDPKRIDAFLDLDEILFDDIPEIRLKDRPLEMETGRLITELSAGQRCSAILPIILLNGTNPIVIDQPEDNLDNRLVREVVVNILAAKKLQRQIILATHNPNLPVLGDVEQAIILSAVGENQCELRAIGDIDNSDIVSSVTDIMEGGREAFQYRQSVYQTHWEGPVTERN